MMYFWFLYDNPEKSELKQDNLYKEINFLLDSDKFSWDKIYLFSAFVNDYGVEQIEKILVDPSLNENTEVLIAIGQKDNFNKPSDIQNLLKFIKINEESTKIKTNSVRFICPKNNFHIKAYCFLGRRVIDKKEIGKEIGFSIIGSSNLTWSGLKCEGELCISIHHLNLTKELIYRLSNKYSNSPQWDQEIREYEIKYDEKHPRKDQALITSTPLYGKFIELGVLTDSFLLAKATNLTNPSEKIYWFHSSPTTIEQAKENFPERSLCLLFSTENKIFQIGEIRSHSSYQENPEGCFVTYKENVTYELSEDIRDILTNEKYKIISDAKDMEELPYEILKNFEEEVKEYQEYQKMLNDPKYKKWIEKGKNKMKSEINKLLENIEEIDPNILKKKLEEIRDSRNYSL